MIGEDKAEALLLHSLGHLPIDHWCLIPTTRLVPSAGLNNIVNPEEHAGGLYGRFQSLNLRNQGSRMAQIRGLEDVTNLDGGRLI